jgi:hypothetical protein
MTQTMIGLTLVLVISDVQGILERRCLHPHSHSDLSHYSFVPIFFGGKGWPLTKIDKYSQRLSPLGGTGEPCSIFKLLFRLMFWWEGAVEVESLFGLFSKCLLIEPNFYFLVRRLD